MGDVFDENIERFEAVFALFSDYNLKLKASKCNFLKRTVKYLVHNVRYFLGFNDCYNVEDRKMIYL